MLGLEQEDEFYDAKSAQGMHVASRKNVHNNPSELAEHKNPLTVETHLFFATPLSPHILLLPVFAFLYMRVTLVPALG